MKSMKVMVALFAVLGLVGLANAATIPFSDDLDSQGGTLSSGGWTGLPSGEWCAGASGPVSPLNIVAGGPGTSTQAAEGNYLVSQIKFSPGIGSGQVQVGFDFYNNGSRLHMAIFGDGNVDDNDHHTGLVIINGQNYTGWNYRIGEGQGGVEDTDWENWASSTMSVQNDWQRIIIDIDFGTNSLAYSVQDVDDDNGGLLGSPTALWNNSGSSIMPFATLDRLGFAIWAAGNLVDNPYITPEPVTLSILALGAGLALMRRRR